MKKIFKGYVYESLSNPLVGGVGDSTQIDLGLLVKGAMVEKEHVGDLNDPEKLSIALDIARDHLAESPRYYEELEKMEEKLEHDKDRTPVNDSIPNSSI